MMLLSRRLSCSTRIGARSLVQFHTRVPVSSANGGASPPRRRRLKSKLPGDAFVALATQFLDRVELAVEPLHPPMNASFVLDRSTSLAMKLCVNPEKEFEIKVLTTKQQLEFTSPISGVRKYEWNPKSMRWEDETDAHDMEGLLTRDLMRLCVGVPNF